jgi:hypothetical protein
MKGKAQEGLIPAQVWNIIARCYEFHSLLVPAFVDFDRQSRVFLFPKTVFLGSGSGFIYFGIDEATGQLYLGESDEVFMPEELADEPSITPTFVDLTGNYLGDGYPLTIKSTTFYADEQSLPREGKFRGVEFEFQNGEGVTIDPLTVAGIRISSTPDANFNMFLKSNMSAMKILPEVQSE